MKGGKATASYERTGNNLAKTYLETSKAAARSYMPCGAKMIFPTLQIGKNVGCNLKPASLLEDSFLVMVCEDGSLARATDLSSSQKSVGRPALSPGLWDASWNTSYVPGHLTVNKVLPQESYILVGGEG